MNPCNLYNPTFRNALFDPKTSKQGCMYLLCTSCAARRVETKYALCGLVFPYVKPMEISAPNIGHFSCVAALLNY